MLRVLLFFAFLSPALCTAQVDTTAISFDEVTQLRRPGNRQLDSMIMQLKSLPGIKLDTNCVRKVKDLLNKYRNEDDKERRKLVNQANSYAAGWREKIPGRCGAGGPPPICPVDHWYKANVGAAMAEFHSIHRNILTNRLNELWRALDGCILERPMKVKMIKEPTPIEKKNEPGEMRVILQK